MCRQRSQFVGQGLTKFRVAVQSKVAGFGNQRGGGDAGAHGEELDAGQVPEVGGAERPVQTDYKVLGANVDGTTAEFLQPKDGSDVDDDAALAAVVLAHVFDTQQSSLGHGVLKI